MLLPAATDDGPVLLIDRSADGGVVTVVVADAVLLAVLGSVWLPFTVALLVIEPALDGAVTLTVMTALAPEASVLTLQVRVPFLFVQVPWVELADLKVTPEGKVSVTTTPVAVLGPLFVAVTV